MSILLNKRLAKVCFFVFVILFAYQTILFFNASRDQRLSSDIPYYSHKKHATTDLRVDTLPEPAPSATESTILDQPTVTTVTADARGTKRKLPSSSSELHSLPPEPVNGIGRGLSNGSTNAEGAAQAGTKRKAVPIVSNQKGNIATLSSVRWKEGLDRDLNETRGTVRVGVQRSLLSPLTAAPAHPNGSTNNTEGVEQADTKGQAVPIVSNQNGDISTISSVHCNETQENHDTMHVGVQSSLLSPAVTLIPVPPTEPAPSATEFTDIVHHHQ